MSLFGQDIGALVEIAHQEVHLRLEIQAGALASANNIGNYIDGKGGYAVGVSDECPQCHQRYTLTAGQVPEDLDIVDGWAEVKAE